MPQKTYWVQESIITALGIGKEEHLEALEKKQSGLQKCSDYWAGKIDWSRIQLLPQYTPLESLMIQCIQDLKFDFTLSNVGIIFSTTKGNIDLLSGNSAQSIVNGENDYNPSLLLENMAKHVADYFNISSMPTIISNACISGVTALIMAQRWIDSGKYEQVIVVGGDLLTPFVVEGFQSFKSMDVDPCRPYDASRTGLSLGEACGAVWLSNSKELALAHQSSVQLLGGCISNDANHISGPSRTGDGLYAAMKGAMEEAQVVKEDIAFLSPHGTATLYNDEMESKAIALAELTYCPLNSMKPYFGHSLGACGVIETIVSVWQLEKNKVYPTLGYKTCGVSVPLSVSVNSQIVKGDCALKMASGFGGCNAALVLSKIDKKGIKNITNPTLETIATVELKQDTTQNYKEHIRQEYKALNRANLKFYKMDDLSKLGYVLSEQLMQQITLPADKSRVALLLCNESSSLVSDSKHQLLIDQQEMVSPAIFVYTLPNIVSGEICIRHKIKGENTFLIGKESINNIAQYAQLLIERGSIDMVIYGTCEYSQTHYYGKLTCIQKTNN
ncbi:beta-ACP synthase [Gammaproteobacteria bacterium]|nr:beta-ACP synthase [Gammaproteobacteria bacterium]